MILQNRDVHDVCTHLGEYLARPDCNPFIYLNQAFIVVPDILQGAHHANAVSALIKYKAVPFQFPVRPVPDNNIVGINTQGIDQALSKGQHYLGMGREVPVDTVNLESDYVTGLEIRKNLHPGIFSRSGAGQLGQDIINDRLDGFRIYLLAAVQHPAVINPDNPALFPGSL